jgi:hypothetical protein
VAVAVECGPADEADDEENSEHEQHDAWDVNGDGAAVVSAGAGRGVEGRGGSVCGDGGAVGECRRKPARWTMAATDGSLRASSGVASCVLVLLIGVGSTGAAVLLIWWFPGGSN